MTAEPSSNKPFKHSFANELLHRRFLEIYQGEQQILKFYKNVYGNSIDYEVDTTLTIGLNLAGEQEVQELREYRQLLDLGYMVISVPFSGWFKGQKVAYKIVSKDLNCPNYEKIPSEHKIYWDVFNQRIIMIGANAGPHGQGSWVNMEKIRNRAMQKSIKLFDYIKHQDKIEIDHMKRFVPHNPERAKRIKIEEIAVIRDNQGRIICLPKSMDESHIGIVGQTGKGKSLLLHRIVDLGYWKGQRMIAILNDEKGECGSWNRAWDTHTPFGKQMIRELAMIGEQPLPLPTVFVAAMNNRLKSIPHEEECGVRMSFPFDDLINNYENYIRGKKDWELGNSLTYFKNIKESVLLCKTLDEIKETIDMMIDKTLQATKNKLCNVMEDIFNENMLDKTNGIDPQLKLVQKDPKKQGGVIGEMKYNPFVTLMLAGAVPVFETASLKAKGYFSQYFRYIGEDIFTKQNTDMFFKNNQFRMWLVCDEVQGIDSKGKLTAASETLIKIATEGRFSRTRLIWASQNPERLNDQIVTNTPYLFVLGFSNNEQANAVCKNFDIMRGREHEIKHLQKREVIACTSEYFIVYERDGTRRKSEPGESFKGVILPPLSEHMPPSTEAA